MSLLRKVRRKILACRARTRKPLGHTRTVAVHHSLDDLLGALKAKGLRATAARRAVLATILEAGDDHLTAEDLAERIGHDQPTTHLSTIYRTLESLSDAGLLTQARFADRPVTFHLADDVHHHAVCDTCGDRIDFSPALLDDLTARLDAAYGFAATPRHLTITGKCRACRGVGPRDS